MSEGAASAADVKTGERREFRNAGLHRLWTMAKEIGLKDDELAAFKTELDEHQQHWEQFRQQHLEARKALNQQVV